MTVKTYGMQLVRRLIANIRKRADEGAAKPWQDRSTILPIKQTVLPNGTRRYFVMIQVGSATIRAGLDTGSTGLRILGNTITSIDTDASDVAASQTYSAGIRVDGVIAQAKVALGRNGLRGKTPFHLVKSVKRLDDRKRGAAGDVSLDDYRFQGDGFPGEGFEAILGLNMAQTLAPNPLIELGVKNWIVDLPLPGQWTPGRLILDPPPKVLKSFRCFRTSAEFGRSRGGIHDAIAGRLLNLDLDEELYGPALLDTGAPGISILGASSELAPWPNGARVALTLGDKTHGIRIDFSVGRRASASRMGVFHKRRLEPLRLIVGTMPYFACRVLYDVDNCSVGLKPRFFKARGLKVRRVAEQ